MRHAPCRLFVLSLVLASLANTAHADPQTVSRLGWVLNGNAQAATQVGTTLYAGGTFTRVAPASGALGSAFDLSLSTGAPTSLLPLTDGVVNAIEPDGAGGYYVGGAFTTVDAVPRRNLVHILSDGTVDPTFAPTFLNGHVLALARGSSFLFVSGTFSGVNGAPSSTFIALDPVSGATATFAVNPAGPARRILIADSRVIIVSQTQALALEQTNAAVVWNDTNVGLEGNDAVLAGGRLIIGGRGMVTGARMLVSLDPATGVIDESWTPAAVPASSTQDVVESLAVSGSTLYVGGTFATFGGQTRANAAAVDIAAGTITSWAPTIDATVRTLAASPGGTIVLGGNFAQVNGEVREDFAEVDASGTLLAWAANAYTAGVRTLRIAGDTLLVGATLGVTGGEARTNLVAFNLGSNSLLPWAPTINDDVVSLAAAGGSVFIGATRVVQLPTPHTIVILSSVNAETGAPEARPLPAPGSASALLGADGDNVYLSAGELVRFNTTTNAIDPGWRVPLVVTTRMAISNGIGYVAAGPRLAAVDLRTGTLSPWNPQLADLGSPVPESVTVFDVAVDGRTVYAALQTQRIGFMNTHVRAFDAVSGLPVAAPGTVSFPVGDIGAIAVADGQLIAGAGPSVLGDRPATTRGLRAYAANGQELTWNPGYILGERQFGLYAIGLHVTATDIVVLGYHGASPVPVQGIAVLPRTPALVPTSLTANAQDSLVALQWSDATPLPASYQIEAGTESGVANVLLHVPGTPANSLVASAGNGTYYVRVRNANADSLATSAPTNEIALVIGCTAAPAPPSRLTASVAAANVGLTWWPPPFASPSSYVIEAGLTAGATDVSLPTAGTSFDVAAPPGTYHVRVRARNACGLSEPTGEIFFAVGGAGSLPPAVQGVSATVAAPNVLLQWTAQPGAVGYVLEAGIAPGRTDLTFPTTVAALGVGGVPTGRYYVRVRAVNATGVGAASDELVVIVP